MSNAVQKDFWNNKKVLITGHTGFKGAWMAYALTQMGAQVSGIALEPNTSPSLFQKLKLQEHLIEHHILDIREHQKLEKTVFNFKPDIVFHMAAQALVRPSYEDPRGTYETNVMGTLNVLEAIRQCDSVQAAVMITTDKCYENIEKDGYRYKEEDPMGGFDPYSSSKGCAEILSASYRQSFFQGSAAKVATVRAGNVIGGGDWSLARIIPDIIRAVKDDGLLSIRYPQSTRPWQHVLDPLRGYALLAQKLCSEQADQFTEAWNFGPMQSSEQPVQVLVETAKQHFPKLNYEFSTEKHAHEAKYLALDSTKAITKIGWEPKIDLNTALDMSFKWYQAWLSDEDLLGITEQQVKEYF